MASSLSHPSLHSTTICGSHKQTFRIKSKGDRHSSPSPTGLLLFPNSAPQATQLSPHGSPVLLSIYSHPAFYSRPSPSASHCLASPVTFLGISCTSCLLYSHRFGTSYSGHTFWVNFVDICVQHPWWKYRLLEGRNHLSLLPLLHENLGGQCFSDSSNAIQPFLLSVNSIPGKPESL